MRMMNITKCKNCGYSLIDEELDSHICKKVIDYKIQGKIIWLFDGEIWYPRKILPPKNKHPFTTPEDSTEPNYLLILKE